MTQSGQIISELEKRGKMTTNAGYVSLGDIVPDDYVCPNCGGDSILLGLLGQRVHFRCQNCGIDYSIPPVALRKEEK